MERTRSDAHQDALALADLPLPAWLCDAAGRILSANPAWAAYVGELTTHRRTWLTDRLLHPNDVTRARLAWTSARATDDVVRVDTRLRRFDGTWRWNVLTIAPTPADRPQHAWIGTFTDVETFHSEHPDRLREQRLERLRSEIIATVEHELRTPLTSIHGLAVTLRTRHRQLTPAVRRDLLEAIVDQTGRMARTVDEFVDAWRVERGWIDVHGSSCDVAACIRSAISAVVPDNARTRRVVLDGGEPHVFVRADERRLRHVLGNLVECALASTPEDRRVHLCVHASADEVRIDVADRGTPMNRSEHAHLFERFHQAKSIRARGVSTTGLGLYVARELARQMGGDVTVRAGRRRGTTYTLRLPAS